jgi:hypothetical protein
MVLGDHMLETVIAVPGFALQDYVVTLTLTPDACGYLDGGPAARA